MKTLYVERRVAFYRAEPGREGGFRRISRRDIVRAWLQLAGWMVLEAKGRGEVCRQQRVTEQRYYRWRKEYGGLRVEHARQLKQL